MSRVVVIGGGVIGCAVAERLSLDRHQVTLLERDQLGCRASGAAAGELSPSDQSGEESLAMFPELVARIEKDSSMNVEYRLQQGLKPAFTEAEAATLKKQGGRWLDAVECRKTEPALARDIVGAVLLEHAHLIPPRFVRALARQRPHTAQRSAKALRPQASTLKDVKSARSEHRQMTSAPTGSSSLLAHGRGRSLRPPASMWTCALSVDSSPHSILGRWS